MIHPFLHTWVSLLELFVCKYFLKQNIDIHSIYSVSRIHTQKAKKKKKHLRNLSFDVGELVSYFQLQQLFTRNPKNAHTYIYIYKHAISICYKINTNICLRARGMTDVSTTWKTTIISRLHIKFKETLVISENSWCQRRTRTMRFVQTTLCVYLHIGRQFFNIFRLL